MTARAVLVDERDRQLGTIAVTQACFIIKHGDALFVRTGKMVRLRGNPRAAAVVFEQAEVYDRPRLEAI